MKTLFTIILRFLNPLYHSNTDNKVLTKLTTNIKIRSTAYPNGSRTVHNR